MDSDDDFLDTSMVSQPSASKKRSRQRSQTKVKKKAKLSPTLTMNEDENSGNCVNCQMPFNLLHRWESPEVHTSSCLETDFSKLQPCPQGLSCDNTIRSHFAKFNHLDLASFRDTDSSFSLSQMMPKDEIPPELPPTQMKKFKFKKVDAKVTSSEESKETPKESDVTKLLNVSKSHNQSGDSIVFINDESEPKDDIFDLNESTDIFETAENQDVENEKESVLNEENGTQESNFSDDDDDLFEELTNKALEIKAQEDSQGAVEIRVQVNPKVELETLVMKIPSQEKKINVQGRLSAKKQSTLDSFFGLKPKAVIPSQPPSFASSKRQESSELKQRNCPFYKKIPETTFTVDAFNYGNIEGISHYFLSHFHYDHYGGMTKHWNQPVICSPITAKLILLKIKVDQKHLTILHLNQPTVIKDVQVTLLDANHCPGSVMFLFKLPRNGPVILHTGDFRANPEMEEYPQLWNEKIDKLYLDTTYCKPEYDFPNQGSVISSTVQIVKRHLKSHSKTLICVGSYTVGKERIFTAIANEIDAKIWGNSEKVRVLKTLSDPIIDAKLTKIPKEAQIHVVEMFRVKKKDALIEHLAKHQDKFDCVLGIVPTGWTHERGSSSDNSLSSMSIKSLKSNVYQLNVPYSEHSSYGELKRFVNFLKLGSSEKILATVNVGNPVSRNAQKAIFKKWIEEGHQSKLKRFF